MLSTIARIVIAIGWAIAGVLAVCIALVLLDVNEDQSLVNAVLEVGRFFAEPFRQIVQLDDNDMQIAINWGIGAAVYVAVAMGIAALLRMADRRGHDSSHAREPRAEGS